MRTRTVQYGRDPSHPRAVGQGMDEAQIWEQLEDQGERRPLLTPGEARAVVVLLCREGSDAGAELAARLARRLPAEE
ncbi:hypothetical protein [Streptomyces malaysiensis]|uniref:hypothetical protein n=1 Tax=Streptomyces malaysiensis TaxID=92644 RepID=UPI0011CDD65E|nr:hypothetical protein [Streptomyces malaysiensis]